MTEARREVSGDSFAAHGPSPLVGLANCFATRYGRFRIRIQSPTMQLGLRFAAAKLPGLRIGRGTRNLVEFKRGLDGKEAIEYPGTLLSPAE